ncbi:MAG: hypothetical protein HY811_01745 [Planctomycetes bacterium]|nr:hypothetical protein [Planctomycetota bacterium]
MVSNRLLPKINWIFLVLAIGTLIFGITSLGSGNNPQNLEVRTPTGLETDNNPSSTKPLDFYKNIISNRNIFSRTPDLPQTKPEPEKLFLLKGIIFDPKNKLLCSAIINYLPLNKEKPYYEEDDIYGWSVKLIEKSKVILINTRTREELILTTASDTLASGSGSGNTPTPLKPEEYKSYPIDREKLSKMPMEQIKQEIKTMLKDLPPEFIYEKIEEFTGITKTEITPNIKLDDYATNLFMISQGGTVPGDGEKIVFGAQVNPDNTPLNQSTNFKTTDTRIYASFPNQGGLAGLSKVIVRWSNTTDGTIAYLGTKPINPNSTHNYVYVEKRKGWAKGIYLVELFKVDTTEKIALGRFEIKD